MITVKELLDEVLLKPKCLSAHSDYKPVRFIIKHLGEWKYELCAPVTRIKSDNNKYCYINNSRYYDSQEIIYCDFIYFLSKVPEESKSNEIVFEVLDKQQGRIFNTSDANIDRVEINEQPLFIAINIIIKD